jgi:hypothetical protein
MASVTPRRPSSDFLASVRQSLLDDFEPELALACKVAVYRAAGYRHSEIGRMLEASPAALHSAEQRLKKAAERLEGGD